MSKIWLNPKELEEIYGISRNYQAKLRMKKLIPFIKINRLIKYNRFEIDAWIENHKVVKLSDIDNKEV